MIVVRFFLRFIVVPFAIAVASLVATVVACFAHWTQFAKLLTNDPNAVGDVLVAALFVGPIVISVMAVGALAVLMPALLGVLISEAFAIRSWMFHAANGALSSWLGWVAMEDFRKSYEFFNDPVVVVGAGIAAGFAYWAIAGWNAGFWKPVVARRMPAPSPPAPPPAAASRPPTVQAG